MRVAFILISSCASRVVDGQLRRVDFRYSWGDITVAPKPRIQTFVRNFEKSDEPNLICKIFLSMMGMSL